MSLATRLARLERQQGDRCPGCGFRPTDIRTIEIRRTITREEVDAGAPVPPLVEQVAGELDQPGRPRCEVCHGYMPPVAFVRCYEGPADGD
jgi:hypothetical protein